MHRHLLLSIALFAACGDDNDNNNNNNNMTPDAAVNPTPDAAVGMPQAFVVSGDFDMTGILSKLDVTSLAVTENVATAGAVAGDPVLRQIGNRLYVVNRLGGNSVTVLNAATNALIDQFSTGENSNPQDVAVVGNDLYVPAMGTTGMVKINTTNGDTTTIDLGTALGDAEPDCVSAVAVGNRVFAACGLLDNFVPSGNGKVAVYDTVSGNVAVVNLPAQNPLNFMVASPAGSVFAGDLLIPLVPSYSDYSTGCIARITTGATPTASCADGLDNADIGGFAQHIDVAGDGSVLWLAVGTLDASFANPTGRLKGFDLETGSLWADPVSPTSQLVVDLAACPDGSVVVVDRTMNASGLRVYKDATERTTAALSFGLPPAFGNNTVCYDPGTP